MNITVIIPIHEIDASYHSYIEKSITSLSRFTVKPTEVLLIGPELVLSQLKEKIDTIDTVNKYRLIVNNEDTSYCNQVNLAVKEVNTEFFTVLEIDDDINQKFFEKLTKYEESGADIYMPILVHTNVRNELLFLSNATAWIPGQTEVKGNLDITALQSNKNYDLTGSVVRKKTFESVGGFKPQIKITFNRELLLRMMYISDAKTIIVPIFGYQHITDRPNSLFDIYKKQNISKEEFDFWQKIAETEYMWEPSYNRTIEYNP